MLCVHVGHRAKQKYERIPLALNPIWKKFCVLQKKVLSFWLNRTVEVRPNSSAKPNVRSVTTEYSKPVGTLDVFIPNLIKKSWTVSTAQTPLKPVKTSSAKQKIRAYCSKVYTVVQQHSAQIVLVGAINP